MGTLTQNIIESTSYHRGGGTLWDVQKRVRTCFDKSGRGMDSGDSKKQFILNIGSDKSPEFAFRLAGLYKKNEVHHLCGNRNKPKIYQKYNRKNLITICDKSLEPIYQGECDPFYDMAIAFLTFHELEDPYESIIKASQVLKPGGIMVIYDYNLSEWKSLVAEKAWSKGKEEKKFSRYVFTEGQEEKVFGFRRGVKIPRRLRMLRRIRGIIEVNCIENHIEGKLEDYLETLENAHIKPLEMVKYFIKVPKVKQPKMFLYIGEKQK